MKMVRILIVLGLLGGWTTDVCGQMLRGAAAVRTITPNPLLPISGGVGVPTLATEKQGDLYVRAMVLAYGETKVALVSIDNLGWPAVLADRARALVPNIPPEHILIGATHTHSAPDAYGFPDEQGRTYADLNYLELCIQRIAEAIREADQRLEAVELRMGYGKVRPGIAYNYYAPDLYDPQCGVLQIRSLRTGKPLATLINFAVHPEVLGSKRGILSPDICGPLYQAVEESEGGIALFFNGALGGMVTADNRRPDGEVNSWDECERIGRQLAAEAIALLGAGKVISAPRLAIKSQYVDFPVETPVMQYILQHSPLGYRVHAGNRVRTVVNMVELGPARMVTIPGEALPNIGLYLKRKMGTQYPFLLGLTNDAFGYMLTRVDYGSFERYNYITRTSLGEETGEIYINEVLKLFNNP